MRITVLSDIHANFTALEAVLADAGPSDAVWCLGDLVGYGPDPNECVELVRGLKPVCIPGNHDWAVTGKIDITDFNHDAGVAALWTRERITPANRAYLDGLAETAEAGSFSLVHGTPRRPIWEYLLSPEQAQANFPLFKTTYCLVGHSHVPLMFTEAEGQTPTMAALLPSGPTPLGKQRLFLNPGSVGQPRDGNPDASYMLLDLPDNADDTAGTFELRRVPYDIAATQKRMREADLPEKLILRLRYGW